MNNREETVALVFDKICSILDERFKSEFKGQLIELKDNATPEAKPAIIKKEHGKCACFKIGSDKHEHALKLF